MNFQNEFDTQWIVNTKEGGQNTKRIDVLMDELNQIKENMTKIEEHQRILTNLSKLYN